MARMVRAEVFDPAEVSVFHCLNRCVRQAFLCGVDRLTGRNFDHRKAWLEERLKFLAGVFGIDVLSFAIMSNHFHVVLRNRPDVVAEWSDDEVARRWLRLCPARKNEDGSPAEPTDAERMSITNCPERLAEIRRRLSDISWLMRMISEPVARRANAEDRTTGRFWQGRFKSVKLLDEAAVLACAAYVDLNPIRAGVAETLEESDFTSAQRRIESRPLSVNSQLRPDDWLAPVELEPVELIAAEAAPGPQLDLSGRRASTKGFLPLSTVEYLLLVEWTGRQLKRGKAHIADHVPSLLARLGIDEEDWLSLARNFGQLFHRVAGSPRSVRQLREQTGRQHRAPAALLGSG